MSRLIVKNLPNNASADKVKERFSEKGRVTDIQMKYTPDGKFRKFCFIGYDTPEEAQNAIDYFHNSFFGTSRIRVELCAELGDKNKPKSWSKYAVDSSAYEELHKQQVDDPKPVKNPEKEKKKKKNLIKDPKILDKLKKHKDDPDFVEFLECYGIGRDVLPEDEDKSGKDENNDENEVKVKTEKEEDKSLAHAPISDLEYLKLKMKPEGSEKPSLDIIKSDSDNNKQKKELEIKLFTVSIRNLPCSAKKKDIKSLFNPLVPASIRFVHKIKGVAYAGFKTEKEMKKALIKNKTFYSGRQIHITQWKEKAESNENQKRWTEQNELLSKEETIAESGRIFVRNLSYTTTEDELREMFSKFGPISEVIIPVDRLSRQVKGFGIITFLMPEHAVAAFMALDGTIHHGRMLHLLPGKAKESDENENEETSYKAKKEKELKMSAQSSHTWNTLFLSQDAVANVIAEKYNATKKEVLTGTGAAVRLALGETQIVAETRQFLEDNGVKLDVFNQVVNKRSKTVILVKNLPANTLVSEIRDIFAKFGELGRVVLPPFGITGIVEFLEPSEARKAFTNLAYSKFKHLPLYLEWAPENTFTTEPGKKNEIKESNDNEGTEEAKTETKEVESEAEEELQPEPDTTLFVKNLNFKTDEEVLKKHFSGCGKIVSATIARKKDPANPGNMLSMGYGFVQFYLKSSVNEAMKTLQGSELEGHRIELKRSSRTLHTEIVNPRKTTNMKLQTGTKILVRNIAFQATAREIEELFKPFGELKSVRLPKKMVGTGPHRGFGFVEFVTKHDAKRAMKALCQSTHFFGRRLVLEWAETEEDIDQIRKRTAKHFITETTSSKKSKKAIADIEIEGEDLDKEEEF